jgi:hypothetical protein
MHSGTGITVENFGRWHFIDISELSQNVGGRSAKRLRRTDARSLPETSRQAVTKDATNHCSSRTEGKAGAVAALRDDDEGRMGLIRISNQPTET